MAAEGDWKKWGVKNQQQKKTQQQQTESFDAPTALRECQWGHCHKTSKTESEKKDRPFLFFWTRVKHFSSSSLPPQSAAARLSLSVAPLQFFASLAR